MSNADKPARGLNRSRQYDIFRPEQAMDPVTVIGAGGIGSPTVLLLAKMGVPDITVFDFDAVKEENRASQFFRREDIDKPKVTALAEQCGSQADCVITARAERYVGQPLSGVVISAVDSMDARLEIWEKGVRWNPNINLFIDGRMGGQLLRVFALQPWDTADVARYAKHLYPSSEASETPCTEKAICYTTFGIASMISGTVKRWWTEGVADFELTFDFGSMSFMKQPATRP